MADDHFGGRLNPMNYPSRLQQYRTKDGDESDARDVHDPHKWDDPDPSLRERITPSTVGGRMGALAVFLMVGGLTFYLFPVFAPAFRNETVLIGVGVVTFLILFHLWSRQQGVEAMKRIDKSIIYFGNQALIRLGEYKGTDGRSDLFSPYTNLSYGGFNARHLKKRDLDFDPARLRSNMGRRDRVGNGPVVDRLNQSTVEEDTETIGKVLITHAESMEYDGHANESDRFTTRPATIDEDVARQMNEMIQSLETHIRTLEQQKTMLEERVDDIRETRRMAIVDELNGAINLLEKMTDIAAQQRYPHRQRQQTGDSGGVPSKNGDGPLEQLQRQVAEELEDQ
jgi:hypothetical protein